jgi:nuclear transport factor 2 (NTF2) superfamily protein
LFVCNKDMRKITPPFTKETAKAKVQAAEDAWNSKDPEKVALAYAIDSKWRNRDLFFTGRKAIAEFLSDKWNKELHYKLKKYLWSFTKNRISVRFEYEWQDAKTGQWKRTYGNEHWEFNPEGLMIVRDMSANNIDIEPSERKF